MPACLLCSDPARHCFSLSLHQCDEWEVPLLATYSLDAQPAPGQTREREIVLPLAIYSCAEDFLSLADSIAANSPPPPPTAFISISFSIYRQSLSHSLSSLPLALCCCFSCLWRRLIRFAIWYAQARLPLRKIRAVIQLLAAKCKKERELWQSRNLRSLRVISSLQARFTISSTDSLYRRMDPSFVLLCCVGWVRPFGSRRRA